MKKLIPALLGLLSLNVCAEDIALFVNEEGLIGVNSEFPKSNLDIQGSVGYKFIKVQDDHQLGHESIVFAENEISDLTLTLPNPIGCVGRYYFIKKTTEEHVTFLHSDQSIDQHVTWELKGINQSLSLLSDGETWQILNNNGAIPVIPFKDEDQDGLDDDWEQFLADSNPTDIYHTIFDIYPDGDFDVDGISNLDEFTNQTNPIQIIEEDENYVASPGTHEQPFHIKGNFIINTNNDYSFNSPFIVDGGMQVDNRNTSEFTSLTINGSLKIHPNTILSVDRIYIKGEVLMMENSVLDTEKVIFDGGCIKFEEDAKVVFRDDSENIGS